MADFQRDQIAKINIRDLRLRTFIGINEDEKKTRAIDVRNSVRRGAGDVNVAAGGQVAIA